MNPAATSLLGLLAPELVSDATSWIRSASEEDPAEAVVWTSLLAAQLFFKAEVGTNPKVKTLDDALVFVTTNLSVGYCDIYAMTPFGKQIASWLMVFGPALAARALDEPKAQKEAAAKALADLADAREARVLERLDRIAALLEKTASSQDVAPQQAEHKQVEPEGRL